MARANDDRPRLTQAELSRATLARQGLLEPVAIDTVTAVERFGGLQAQEPASPSIALWTRLAAFQAEELDAAFRARNVVKATLMRATLHAVSATDYRALLPAVLPMLRAIRRGDRREAPDLEHLALLSERAAAFTREPRSLTELREHLADHAAHLEPEEVVWWLRRHMTFVHAPAEDGSPWSFGRRPRIVEAGAWLGADDGGVLAFEPEASGVRHLVRRYLRAFGPATVADIAAWSGLPMASLRPAVERLVAESALWHGVDERDRPLIDLPDAPRPPADTSAPPRLLPMWDSVLLAHADRTRVISDADRSIVIARNGDTLPTILVDGRVAGLWWADTDAGGRTRITIEPFRPIPAGVRRALEAEGERLASFVEPIEPRVYARYQRWRVGAARG